MDTQLPWLKHFSHSSFQLRLPGNLNFDLWYVSRSHALKGNRYIFYFYFLFPWNFNIVPFGNEDCGLWVLGDWWQPHLLLCKEIKSIVEETQAKMQQKEKTETERQSLSTWYLNPVSSHLWCPSITDPLTWVVLALCGGGINQSISPITFLFYFFQVNLSLFLVTSKNSGS